tara:strand:+ start:403 stop:570 length:168 start_codon:yes stop_codon:yes gene_type:complete
MNVNDNYVLDLLNRFIVSERLDKSEIIQMVSLVSISHDLSDLKDNLKWETPRGKS